MYISDKTKTSEGYSRDTSLPAFLSNQDEKTTREQQVYATIVRLGGKCCLLQIAEAMPDYPQSSISGRISELKKSNKIRHTGDLMDYKNRKRKVISIVDESK